MADGVLISGGSGLLALNWAIARRDIDNVTLGLHTRRVSLARVATHELTLDNDAAIEHALDQVEPSLVVHTAGLTSVEACEADPAAAHIINVTLAERLARICARQGVAMAHISTDHLVRGDRPLLDESVPPDPQNVYGATKAEAERRVLDANPQALVVRTNFYAWGPTYRRSFSEEVIDALRAGRSLTLFTDVYYTPILAEGLAHAVHDLVDRRLTGLVHVVGDERLSKYAFGLKLAEAFQLDAGPIREGRITDQPSLARRPLDMSLSNARARQCLGRPLGGVDVQLARLVAQEQQGQVNELKGL